MNASICGANAPQISVDGADAALVLCNPIWYPDVTEKDRDRLLSFVERALDAKRLDLSSADAVFA